MGRLMKSSGVEWIGEIPQSWKLIPVKRLFHIGRGRVIAQTELVDGGLYPVFSSQTQNNGCLGYINTYDFDTKQLTWTTDGANAGTVFLREGKHNCTNVCGTLVPKSNNLIIEFALFALSFIAEYHKRLDTNGYKIMNNEMAQIKITFPPLEEQQAIAKFLFDRCTMIDGTIGKQRLVIEKLKQYKQSVITEAVTKGISRNVKMKPSGIAWIGDIPEEWEIKKLKYLFTIKKEIAGEVGHDILSVTQNGIKVKDISNNEGQISQDYSKYQRVEIDDFVMNHMDLLTGYVDCSKFRGVTSPDYRVFFLNNPSLNSKEFYTYVFQTCYRNRIFYGLGQGVSGLGRWRLQTDKFLNFELPVPPPFEQQAIANYLDAKCASIDNIITGKQKLIDKLTDYKKSLTYECVTGKKEVISNA